MPTRVRVLVQRILRSYARVASPAYIGRKLVVTTSSSIFPSVLCLMVEKDSASDTKSFVNMQVRRLSVHHRVRGALFHNSGQVVTDVYMDMLFVEPCRLAKQ